MADNLISQTCLKTPKPNVCVSSLESVPQSSNADITGLALIMSDEVLKAKAQAARNIINELIKHGPSTQSLLACTDYYGIIIEFHIGKQAHDGITGVQPRKAAQQAMDDTVYLVNECNNGLGFPPGSPLTEMSTSVAEIATITKAIVQILS